MLSTPPTGLRMPAREPPDSVGMPLRIDRANTRLLKKHKVLPRPRDDPVDDEKDSPARNKARGLVIDTGVSPMPTVDASSSPRALKRASKRIGAPALPPTPPAHSRNSSGEHVIPPATGFQSSPTQEPITSTPHTPPNQRSPPTPDVTPPRAIPVAFRPVQERYPSSRADSFQTAREVIYSSEDDEASTLRPGLPSARESRASSSVPEKVPKRKEIGLGLGLETEDGAFTPRARVYSAPQEPSVVGVEWISPEEISEVEREWDHNIMRNVTVRKRPRRVHKAPKGSSEVIEDDIVTPTNATVVLRGMPLQERLARRRIQRDLERTPTVTVVDDAAWAAPDPDSPERRSRRLSTMSSRSIASTVIEAVVVTGPPQRRQMLRHSKKQLGLRDFSSDQSTLSSAPNSVFSTEPQHQLIHKNSKIPDRHHRSLASNTTISTSSTARSRREIQRKGGIPVVVIPDRRSSTKPKKEPSLRSTSSRRTKRSASLNSALLSQSSHSNGTGYFDAPTKRTMSESGGSGPSVRTIDYPPVVPVRSSSLSAPTSRNTSRATSRAGSLTVDSLRAHNMLQAKLSEPEQLPNPAVPAEIEAEHSSEPPKDSSYRSPSVDANGDPFFGKRYSTQATPFSQVSYETMGTAAELSEAMAISIFPHQNKSILMVNQPPPSEPSPPAEFFDAVEDPEYLAPPPARNVTLVDKATRPAHVQSAKEVVESPLINPRAPPHPPTMPPVIQFIPPTPVYNPIESDEERSPRSQERPSTADSKSKRALSRMSRPFRRRRDSEPSNTCDVGFLRRTFSLNGRRNSLVDGSTQTSKGLANPDTVFPSVVDQPADETKLHPFWRPAHFWDDLSDDDEPYDPYEARYPIIDNRPSAPKRSLSGRLKHTFAILPIKEYYVPTRPADRRMVRRSTSNERLKVVKRRSTPTIKRDDGASKRISGFGGGSLWNSPKQSSRVHAIPTFGDLRQRLDDRKREQRSNKLRASISTPRGVQHGVDDVLGRRGRA